jgi:hypothetical protein
MRVRTTVLGVFVVAVTTACGVAQGHSAMDSTGQHSQVDGDRHKSYTSIQELARDSTAVVVARADAQKSESLHNVPFTVTSMTVISSIRGNVPPGFRLRQLGSPGSSSAPVVSAGSTYLLFLQPFQLQPGVPVSSDLFVTVGASSGMFLKDGDVFRKTDPDAASLPPTVTESDARRAGVGGTA